MRPAVQQLFRDGYASYEESVRYSLIQYIADKLNTDPHDIQHNYLNIKGGNFWVAEYVSEVPTECPKVVGCVGMLPSNEGTNEINEDITTFELQRMFVGTYYHGVCLAQGLMKEAEDFVFIEQKGLKITLDTGGDMKKACRFYEKMVYKTTHIEYVNVRDIYSTGPNVVVPVPSRILRRLKLTNLYTYVNIHAFIHLYNISRHPHPPSTFMEKVTSLLYCYGFSGFMALQAYSINIQYIKPFHILMEYSQH